jgi:orotate phosphoribosyltransferase
MGRICYAEHYVIESVPAATVYEGFVCSSNFMTKGASIMAKDKSLDNLWLAQTLFDIGAVQFGDFTVSQSAAKSPIFINPKRLVSSPRALQVAAQLIDQEVKLAQSLRHPRVHPFEVLAGIPVGGLVLALAYSLESGVPVIYPRLKQQGTGQPGIEGKFTPGTRALLIDDLITTGGSVVETARFMAEHDVVVKDVIVLVDREQGATDQLRHAGLNLISILKLEVMLNYYRSQDLIDSEMFERSVTYLRTHTVAPRPAMDVADLPFTAIAEDDEVIDGDGEDDEDDANEDNGEGMN